MKFHGFIPIILDPFIVDFIVKSTYSFVFKAISNSSFHTDCLEIREPFIGKKYHTLVFVQYGKCLKSSFKS